MLCCLAVVDLQLLFKPTMSSANVPCRHARQSAPAWGIPKHAVCVLLCLLMPNPSKGLTLCEHTPSACDGSYSSSTLSMHAGLNGVLPTELGLLTNLTSITIFNSTLSGTLPTQLAKLSKLHYMFLAKNNHTGALPTQLGQLTQLTNLNLDFNKFSGVVPTQLGLLTGLGTFSLAGKSISGALPSELGLIASEPSPRPLPSGVMPDRERRDSVVMVDPEDLDDSPPRYEAKSPIALASPRPQPQLNEELMRTNRGVLLSIPLSPGDMAKAMKEAATMKCSNECPTSYDGICSDGATSRAFCSGALAFGAAGRGTCAVAENSDCELGSDCALRPALPNAMSPACSLHECPPGAQAGTAASARSPPPGPRKLPTVSYPMFNTLGNPELPLHQRIVCDRGAPGKW